MKKVFSFLLLFISISSSASSVGQKLKNNKCGLLFNKTVFVNDATSMISLGQVMFAPLMNERNVLLKKGTLYPIIEADDEVITINDRSNIVFLCITDEGQECIKLSLFSSDDLAQASNNGLSLVCD